MVKNYARSPMCRSLLYGKRRVFRKQLNQIRTEIETRLTRGIDLNIFRANWYIYRRHSLYDKTVFEVLDAMLVILRKSGYSGPSKNESGILKEMTICYKLIKELRAKCNS